MSHYRTAHGIDDSMLSRYSYESWTRSESDSHDSLIYGQNDTDLSSLLNAVINNELTQAEKTVIHKRYFENKSVTDTARELSINPSSVTRTTARAEKKIKSYLKYVLYILRGSLPSDENSGCVTDILSGEVLS